MQKSKDIIEWKAVLQAEREHDGIFVGGGLQLEVEAAAEALAQREPPGAVDAPSEGRVNDQLHSPGGVKEALQHQILLCRNDAEHSARCREILHQLCGLPRSET